jgi:hypothetical protein
MLSPGLDLAVRTSHVYAPLWNRAGNPIVVGYLGSRARAARPVAAGASTGNVSPARNTPLASGL